MWGLPNEERSRCTASCLSGSVGDTPTEHPTSTELTMNRYEITTVASLLNDALSRESAYGPRAPRARGQKRAGRRRFARRHDRD